MIAFGEALPRLRRRVTRELRVAPVARDAPAPRASTGAAGQLSRTRVLACAVRLLDLGFFRIGSEDYAERNESYGLTTMLPEHVSIENEELVFDFPAKSGRRRVQAIADPQALELVAALKRRRGARQLLAYREGRRFIDVRAEDVNAFIKEHTGGDFTAKDFRTWNATVLAAVALAAEEQTPPRSGPVSGSRPSALGRGGGGAKGTSKAARERVVSRAIKTTAAYLGNTPAVCRASYVDPRVIDRYQAGVTIAPTLRELPRGGTDLADGRIRARVEAAVLELLADAAPAARRAAA
jgi:DNA topoisomerase IB